MILTSKDGTQSIDFDIPENYKKIAVNCSGGADSSILLLMIVQYLIDNKRNDVTISVTTCSNDKKGRWNGRKAADVIEYVLRTTQFKNFDMHYTYYRDVQDVKYFHNIENKLFAENRIDMLVSGLTANPLIAALVEDINGNTINLSDEALPDRSGSDHKAWYIDDSDNVYWTPFANIDKRFVADMYKLYNATESLLPLTRSCEAIPDSTITFDPTFEKTPCGTCWWCLERKWGFGYF